METLRKEIKLLQQRQRRAASRQLHRFSKKQQRVAMSIYVLDNYKAQAAVEYMKKSKRTWSGDATHQVEQWFLDMPMNELTALNPQRNVKALKFLAEFRTVKFIEECNFQRGHAPTSAEAASAYVRILRELGGEDCACVESLEKSLDEGSRWARRWVQQWRKRWDLSVQVLRTHGVLDLNAKASGGILVQ